MSGERKKEEREILVIPRKEHELLVILIGGVKSGRTTFLRRFLKTPEAQREAVTDEGCLTGVTKEVAMYSVKVSGRDVVLMDTPAIDGCDDELDVEHKIRAAYRKFSPRVRVAFLFFVKLDANGQNSAILSSPRVALMERLVAFCGPQSLFIVSTPPESDPENRMAELESGLQTKLNDALPKPWSCQWTTERQLFSPPSESDGEPHVSLQAFLNKVVLELASSHPSLLAAASPPNQDSVERTDIVIVLVGLTGTGKSTFVDSALGTHTNEQRAHHGLTSSTAGISVQRLGRRSDGRAIVLVDTPGFDDTLISDVDTLKNLSKWLEERYKDRMTISGLLYFHRITDNRTSGTIVKNLALFRKICGREGLGKVVLVTTMWDKLEDQATGAEREQKLLKDPLSWKYLIDHGSTTCRFNFEDSQNSAKKIIDTVISLPANTKPILLQKQLVDIRLSLSQTDAGRVLYSQLHHYIQNREGEYKNYSSDYTQYEDKMKKLQSDIDKHQSGDDGSPQTNEDREKVRAFLEAFKADLEDFKARVNEERLRVTELKLGAVDWMKGGLAKARHAIGL